jgi:hypothetical protein
MRQVRNLLSQPSSEAAEKSAVLLRETEVQLGCAVAILTKSERCQDAEIRATLQELQHEVAVLARFLSEADKLLSGWLQALQARRGGYTQRGQAAPLVLVSKVAVEA